MLLEAHLAAGIEPHGFRCNTASASTCTVTAYNVGASALWRGLVGPAIAIYASEGSPLVPADVTQTAFGDRISATVGLAVRPFAPLGWHRPDGWVSRLAYAFSVEVGPSLEYLRTSAITIAGCDIPATRVQGGASGLFGLDVPVLGDARSGWLSLRASVRVLGNDEAHLAPTANTGGCSALVVMPGVLAQALFGVGYSF
jgi:hypothetical protein